MMTCRQCRQTYDVPPEELALLHKLSPAIAGKTEELPAPTLCPRCRLQRRLAFYNSRTLYRRTCDKTGASIVSIYSPDKPFTVYEKNVWYGDGWDPLDYGVDLDFTRPFFVQFRELMERVPLPALAVIGDNVNSDFTNDNYKLKNCYMVFDGEQAEDSYYGQTFVGLKNCVDFQFTNRSELCYECLHCDNSYNLRFSRYCDNCSDSHLLRDCVGCRHCFGCANLHRREYCIFNQQKSREEYEQFLRTFRSTSHAAMHEMRRSVEAFFLTQPVKAVRGIQNIDCHGDTISQSKNAVDCYDSVGLQDCRNCTDCLMGGKDCLDVHAWGDGLELAYNSALVGAGCRSVIAGYYVTQGAENIFYSLFCSRNVQNLFGCIGLRHKQYCILNKQYSKEDYELLMPKIIEHLRSTVEWGEFFPATISCFGYNETMAQSFFPLSKEAALAAGFQWSGYEVSVEASRTIPASQLPDNTNDVPDDILNWGILCEETGKPFKLIPQELRFYRDQNLPIPRRHPEERHRERLGFKNPYRLWTRVCDKCGKEMETSYRPERPELVYCEECNLESAVQ